jgi:sugar lactone lactonase YvrE
MFRSIACSALLTALLNANIIAQDRAPPRDVWTISEGLAQPESAHYDSATGSLFISNLSGGAADKDGNGWITKADTDGKVIAAQWVKDLNAPKGLRSFQGMLWVTDIDRVLAIDIKSGQTKHTVAVEGARFLNDVAIDNDGVVYVSEMHDSKIFQVKYGKASLFLEDHELAHPNGLVAHDDQLVVASWGVDIDPKTFTTKTPGRILTIDLSSHRITPLTKRPLGNLDGVELDGSGGYYASDFMAGKVFQISSSGEATVLLQDLESPADIGLIEAKSLLIVPHMRKNKVVAYRIGDE